MNDAQVVLLVFVVLVVLEIYFIIRDTIKRGFNGVKYQLKIFANTLSPMLGIIMAVYALIGGIAVVPTIKAWSLSHNLQTSSVLANWMIKDGMTVAWVLFICWFVIWFVSKFRNPFKYTEQEKAWDKESRLYLYSKLPKFLKRMAYKVK